MTAVQFEEAVIGGLLWGQRDILDTALRGVDFTDQRLGELFDIIGQAVRAGVPAEAQAIAGHLVKHGKYQKYVQIMTRLAVSAPAGTVSWYAQQVLDSANRRELAISATRLAQAATDPATDPERLDHLVGDVTRVVAQRTDDTTPIRFGDFAPTALREIELRPTQTTGLTTGFPELDAHLPAGLRPGQLVSICGPTSSGKSTLGLDLARHFAFTLGATTALFSLEMSNQEVFEKIVSAQTDIPHSRVVSGKLTAQEWDTLATFSATNAHVPLFLSDASNSTVMRIANHVRRIRNQTGECDVVIVDYVQLLTGYGRTREQELSQIVRALKRLARDEHVVVIMMVQNNRAANLRPDKRPLLSDIRESGEIENSSNLVLMLYSEAYYDPASPKKDITELWIRKNRSGRKDVPVIIGADHSHARFISLDTFAHGTAA